MSGRVTAFNIDQNDLGLLAAVFALLSMPVYIVDILRHRAKPNRATWWILALSGTLIAASYQAAGAQETVWIAVAFAVGYMAIATLSLKYGEGKWTRLEHICLVSALGSAIIWWCLDKPIVALLVNIGIDLIGILPTIRKVYRLPDSESRPSWLLGGIASILSILAIKQWTFAIAVFPLYLLIVDGLILILTLKPHPTPPSP